MVQYSNERLLEALRECKQRHGKIDTQTLNSDDSLPSGPTYAYRFESLADAAERAGLQDEAKQLRTNQKLRTGYTDDEIVDFVKRIADDGVITPTMISESDGPSSTAVSDYLDVNSLVGESVGDVDIISHTEYKRPDKEVVDEQLQKLSDETVVTYSTIRQTGISISDVKNYYDSIVEARDSLGLEHPKNDNKLTIETPYEYVYVIERGEEMYVGKSIEPIERIRKHAIENEVSLERIVAVPDDREPSDFEREMAMKVARRYDRTDIKGGK